MYNQQNYLQKIISQIKEIIKQIAFDKMTANAYLEPDKVLESMEKYEDADLGTYAIRTLFSH